MREGYIRQTLELTEKAKSILRRDPFTAGDDYWEDWWIDARKAGALVNGTSVTRAAIG